MKQGGEELDLLMEVLTNASFELVLLCSTAGVGVLSRSPPHEDDVRDCSCSLPGIG